MLITPIIIWMSAIGGAINADPPEPVKDQLAVSCTLAQGSKRLSVRVSNNSGEAVVICRKRKLFHTSVVTISGQDLSNEAAVYDRYQFAPAGVADWTVLKPHDDLTFSIGLMLKDIGPEHPRVVRVQLRYVFEDPHLLFALFRDMYGTEEDKKKLTSTEKFVSAGVRIVKSFECSWRE